MANLNKLHIDGNSNGNGNGDGDGDGNGNGNGSEVKTYDLNCSVNWIVRQCIAYCNNLFCQGREICLGPQLEVRGPHVQTRPLHIKEY